MAKKARVSQNTTRSGIIATTARLEKRLSSANTAMPIAKDQRDRERLAVTSVTSAIAPATIVLRRPSLKSKGIASFSFGSEQKTSDAILGLGNRGNQTGNKGIGQMTRQPGRRQGKSVEMSEGAKEAGGATIWK